MLSPNFSACALVLIPIASLMSSRLGGIGWQTAPRFLCPRRECDRTIGNAANREVFDSIGSVPVCCPLIMASDTVGAAVSKGSALDVDCIYCRSSGNPAFDTVDVIRALVALC